MQPNEVPSQLIDMAWEARRSAPPDSEITRMLAAVLPEYEKRIRAKIAAEIEAELEADGDGSSWDGGMSNAARIARGAM